MDNTNNNQHFFETLTKSFYEVLFIQHSIFSLKHFLTSFAGGKKQLVLWPHWPQHDVYFTPGYLSMEYKQATPCVSKDIFMGG